jgi:hypothetical protein
MKKIMMFALAVLVCASVAIAQTYTRGTGITGIDKLGAHQNGGRGCVGCHAPHSGVRGNGGALTINSKLTSSENSHNATGMQYAWSNQSAITGDVGDEELWGQDIGPIASLTLNTGSGFQVDLATSETRERVKTGIVYCLSCHDGNVAKGAMMTNQSFEQSAGLLPSSYGSQPIPTLLGSDGGSGGNYGNDHPIGPSAKVSALSIGKYLDLDSTTTPTKLILKASQPDALYTTFKSNYGLPSVVGARTGAGFAVEKGMTSAGDAYVVCTTCHTPHSMYTASASTTNPIGGLTSGTFPSYFFVAAPYNPGANTANGTKASSATQFCRQCHFTGAGGSNEGSNILTVQTAF